MGKDKKNKPEQFVETPAGDNSEKEAHLSPSDPTVTQDVPVGRWVDVPAGMVAAPGTYVDDHGVLRSSGDNSVVAWHNGRDTRTGKTNCRRGEPAKLTPEEIIYDVNGAPWCPECYEDREIAEEKKKIAQMFASSPEKRN